MNARLWGRIVAEDWRSCWPWIGTKWPYGYGQISYNGRQYPAHRVMWQLIYGIIPDTICVLHQCDNPPCCNPLHLFLGDKATNAHDRSMKGRNASGCSNGNSKLTDEQIYMIRERYSNGRVFQRQLAKEFGVCKNTIWSITKGISYKLSAVDGEAGALENHQL